MAGTPLVRGLQWLWPAKPPMPGAVWVVATHESAHAASGFLRDLATHLKPPLAVLLLDEGPYQGPWPWALSPGLGPKRVVSRLKPEGLVILDDHPLARGMARQGSCPVSWINARSPDLLSLGRVTVDSEVQAAMIGGGLVTGNPCLNWPPLTCVDDAFCSRFHSVRKAGRWIIYFAATVPGEETLAYATFLNISARSGGLLALAPADALRHEEVYRESIKYHLLTTRQKRLITSEVPPKTRVYYIEEESARRAMYACADAIVVGGTFAEGPTEAWIALSAGVPVLVGPRRLDPLVRAAVLAGVVIACDHEASLTAEAAKLMADPAVREDRATSLRDWVALQAGARSRVAALVAADFS